MTVRVYRSSDTNAPILNGTPGSLIAVLDACLVNGYGAKVGSGWIKTHTASNLAAYQMPSGTLRYLRINDTGSNGTNYARARGYEGIMDLTAATGTGLFPTDAQQNGGLVILKSNNAPSTTSAVGWAIVATQTMFYLWTNASNHMLPTADGHSTSMFCFGDIISYVPNDACHTYISGLTALTTTNVSAFTRLNINGSFAAAAGNWLNRAYTQTGGSTACMKFTDGHKSGQAGYMGKGGTNTAPLPDPLTQSISVAPIWIGESAGTNAVRGLLPGVWTILMPVERFNMMSNCEGTQIPFTSGAMAGKTLESFAVSNLSMVWIETSNTW